MYYDIESASPICRSIATQTLFISLECLVLLLPSETNIHNFPLDMRSSIHVCCTLSSLVPPSTCHYCKYSFCSFYQVCLVFHKRFLNYIFTDLSCCRWGLWYHTSGKTSHHTSILNPTSESLSAKQVPGRRVKPLKVFWEAKARGKHNFVLWRTICIFTRLQFFIPKLQLVHSLHSSSIQWFPEL